MPRVNIEEEARKFEERYYNGEFPVERSKNNEVNYAKEKEPRDTQAVKVFTNTDLFRYIWDMK